MATSPQLDQIRRIEEMLRVVTERFRKEGIGDGYLHGKALDLLYDVEELRREMEADEGKGNGSSTIQ